MHKLPKEMEVFSWKRKEEDFKFENLKGKEVIGGRKGGMPEMTFRICYKE